MHNTKIMPSHAATHEGMELPESGLAAFCETAFPIWGRQIEFCRALVEREMESHCERLMRATGRLREIVDAFPDRLASPDTASVPASALTSPERGELKPAHGDAGVCLDSVQDEPAALVAEMRRLDEWMAELTRRVPEHLPLDPGKGPGGHGGAAAPTDVRQPGKADMPSAQVLERFHETYDLLVGSSALLRNATSDIQAEMNDALMALQFQDRVNQILTHLSAHVSRYAGRVGEFRSRLAAGETDVVVDPGPWLDEMKADYTTREEREAHREVLGESPEEGEMDEGEVAFF